MFKIKLAAVFLASMALSFFALNSLYGQTPPPSPTPTPNPTPVEPQDTTVEPIPNIPTPPAPTPPPPARTEIEPTFFDDTPDGTEFATFTGVEPYTEYQFTDVGGGFIAEATTNSCGMMTIKVPKQYPLATPPYSETWNTGVLANGTSFFWINKPDWDNIILTATPEKEFFLPDNLINCGHIVPNFNWFGKLKNNVLIFYANDRDIPKNPTFLVRLRGDGPVPWRFTQRKKSNACGHVSFKYLWTLNNAKKAGYDLNYSDFFELRKGDTLVKKYNWSDDYYWRPRPFCNKGRSFTSEEPINYQNQQ